MRSVTSFVLLTSSVLCVACNTAAPVQTSAVATTGGTPAAIAPAAAGSTAATSAAGVKAPVPTTAGTSTAVSPATAAAGSSAAAGGSTTAVPTAGVVATGMGTAGVSAATAGTGASAAGATAAAGGGSPAAGGGASWTKVYDGVIVESGCVGGGACHQSSAATSKLGLADPMMAYKDLVNTAAMGMNLPGASMSGPNCAGTGTVRVKPSDPDNSLLMQKLEGKQKCGIAMPPGGMIENDKVAMVRDWIKAGAKMD